MATYTANDMIFEKAGDLVKKFFNTEISERGEPAPDIAISDDIGECEPFDELIQLITGEKKGAALTLCKDVSMPFETYDALDADKTVHDFTIQTIVKDRSRLERAMDRYAGFFDSMHYMDNPSELLYFGKRLGATDFPGSILKIAEELEAQKVVLKDMDRTRRLDRAIRSIRKVAAFARDRKVLDVSDAVDSRRSEYENQFNRDTRGYETNTGPKLNVKRHEKNPPVQEVKTYLVGIGRELGIPPEVLWAVAWHESGGMKQFNSQGEPFISFDGGIGIMQVTPGVVGIPEVDRGGSKNSSDRKAVVMRASGGPVARLKSDWKYNCRIGAQVIRNKWKEMRKYRVGDNDPAVLETWYFTLWAYNGFSDYNNPHWVGKGRWVTDKNGKQLYYKARPYMNEIQNALRVFGSDITLIDPSAIPSTRVAVQRKTSYSLPSPAHRSKYLDSATSSEVENRTYFSNATFTCSCGCGTRVVNQGLLKILTDLRVHVGKPVNVHCTVRCASHNKSIKGADNSYHLPSRGARAADLHVEGMSIAELKSLAVQLYNSGQVITGGLGLYSWGIHVDSGPKRSWVDSSLTGESKETLGLRDERVPVTNIGSVDDQHRVVRDLKAVANELEGLSVEVYRKMYSQFASLLVNDMRLKTTSVDIDWGPGTSVFIPLQGENAPVVQSTGGRNVSVTVKFKEWEPADIAKLSLMFRVTNSDDELVSMLRLTRSTYKATEDNRSRLKYLLAYVSEETLKRTLEDISGMSKTVRLDEPVRIQNDLLNSLGLRTFIPSAMEVQSSQENAGVFDISITFNYINLGYRGDESLRKLKSGMNVPVLPVGCRLQAPGSVAPVGEESLAGNEMHHLIHTLASLSTRYGIAEIVPVYVLYKLNQLAKHLSDISKEQNDEDRVWDLASTSIAAVLGMDHNQWSQVVKHIYGEMDPGSTVPGEMVLSGTANVLGIYYTGKLHKAFADGVRPGSLTGAAKTKAISKLSRVKGIGGIITRGLAFGIPIAGTASTAYVACKASLGREKFLLGKGKEGSFDSIILNIADLVPILMFDFLRDFVLAVKGGKNIRGEEMSVDRFMSYIAEEALDLVSTSVPHSQAPNAVVRSFPGQKVAVLDAAGRRHMVGRLIIRCDVGGIHVAPRSATGFVPSAITQGVNVLGLSTGLKKVKENIQLNLQAMQAAKNPADLPYLAASMVNLWSVDVLSCLAGIFAEEGSKGDIGKVEETALRLSLNSGARKHAGEVVSAVITSSLLDVLASGVLLSPTTSSKRVPKVTDADARIIGQAADAFAESIRTARVYANTYQIGYETLSGMFVEGSFTAPALKEGYCNAMLSVLSLVERIALGSVTPKMKSIMTPGISIMTVPEILAVINPSFGAALSDSIVALLAKVNDFLVEMQSYLVVDGASFLLKRVAAGGVAGFLGKLLGWVGWVIMFFDIGSQLWNLSAETANIILRTKNLFSISEWLAGRIRDGLDSALYIEMCYISKIWCRSGLDYGNDAFDTLQSSYADYPVVTLNGRPAMPDLYVYKIGFLEESYSAMLKQMQDMIQSVEERSSGEDALDVDKLKRELMSRLKGMESGLLSNLAALITRLVLDFADDAAGIAKIGEKIDTAIYGGSIGTTSLVYVTVLDRSGTRVNGTGTPPESRCALTILVNLQTRSVNITTNDLFNTIVNESALQEKIKNDTDVLGTIKLMGLTGREQTSLEFICPQIIKAVKQLNTHRKSGMMDFADIAPDTVGNLMLLKSLVGNHLHAVGKPGLALMKNQLESVTNDTLRRVTSFRSGYLFPTIKLYFVEEDDEAYYLFDDLYSYASIISCQIHQHRHSAADVATISVTNLYGRLDNIFSDTVNKEMNLFSAPDENAPVDSIMLRPGCRIKIQMGNTPILTEEDTVFTGEIVNIVPGPVTQIEAQGFGAVFMEEISKDSVKEYGIKAAERRNLISRVTRGARQKIASIIGGGYLNPIQNIRDIISYVLYDLTATSNTLSDYTINPGISAEIDRDFKEATTSLTQVIRDRMVPGMSQAFLSAFGADVQPIVNNQLFENVHIHGDRNANRYFYIITPDEGSWVSYNETAWDILQNINLLLPNNLLTVRPYDTRGTLVWGEDDGFYRYRRKTDINSIMSNAVLRKVRPLFDANSLMLTTVMASAVGALKKGDTESKVSAVATLTIASYYAMRIAEGQYPGRVSSTHWFDLSTESGEMARRALRWLSGTDLSDLNVTAFNLNVLVTCCEQLVKAIKDEASESATFRKSAGRVPLEVAFNRALPSVEAGLFDDVRRKRDDRLLVSITLEMAFDLLARYAFRTAGTRSTSHRMNSSFHVKMSGRDMVSNDIALKAPFNTVQLTFPKEDTSTEEVFTSLEEKREELVPVPVHYKLKPWAMKTYHSYYENGNIFPSSRVMTKSMVTGSILANLMKEAYGGQVTFLLDPQMRAGDRLILYDENRDMFGMCGIRSHTILFSAQDGCLSMVEPEMYTRNDNILQETVSDDVFWAANMVLSVIFAGVAAWLGVKGYRKGWRWMKMRSLKQSKDLGFVDDAARYTVNIFEKIPAANRTIAKDGLAQLMKEHQKVSERFIGQLLDAKTALGETVTGEKTLSGIVGSMNKILSREYGKIGKSATNLTQKDISKLVEKALKETLAEAYDKGIRNLRLNELGETFQRGIVDRLMTSLSRTGDLSRLSDNAQVTAEIRTALNEIVKAQDFSAVSAQYDALKSLCAGNEKMRAAIDGMIDYFLLEKTAIWKWLKQTANIMMTLSGLSFALDSGRDIVEMYLHTKLTSDNVTIVPLFCRGEPFIAGLEGMTKKDGEEAGFADIMKSRFADMAEGVYHGVTDPVQEAFMKWQLEKLKARRGVQ